jgi:carbamate kinase
MLIVAAIGRSALSFDGDLQALAARVARIAQGLAPLADAHRLIITHGLGPTRGRLSNPSGAPADLDAARNAGLVGHLLARELRNTRPDASIVSLLAEAVVLPEGAPGGQGLRPGLVQPCRILEQPLLRELAGRNGAMLCVGCVPVMQQADARFVASSSALDHDLVASALAMELEADMLLLLSDVEGVFAEWPATAPPLARLSASGEPPFALDARTMGSKVAAGRRFARTPYTVAVIGRAEEAHALVAGHSGTRISCAAD